MRPLLSSDGHGDEMDYSRETSTVIQRISGQRLQNRSILVAIAFIQTSCSSKDTETIRTPARSVKTRDSSPVARGTRSRGEGVERLVDRHEQDESDQERPRDDLEADGLHRATDGGDEGNGADVGGSDLEPDQVVGPAHADAPRSLADQEGKDRCEKNPIMASPIGAASGNGEGRRRSIPRATPARAPRRIIVTPIRSEIQPKTILPAVRAAQ
jgi:hypothetical protein